MLRKIYALIFAATGILFSGIFSFPADANFSSLKCDMIVESPQIGRSEGRLFMKGDKSRIELNASGIQTVTIVNDQNAYMYMPAQNVAMTMALSQAKGQVPEITDYKKDCEYINDEQVDGEQCGVYRCSKGGQSTTMWIPANLDFPLKVVSGATTTYYKNVNVNVDLDDSLFSLPQGVQYQDVSGLMQGLKGFKGGN